MKTAIIILNWNGAPDTIFCLQSMMKFVNLSTDRIFVIDNNSEDESVQDISNFIVNQGITFSVIESDDIVTHYVDQPISIIKNKKNLGFGAGNNVLLKKIKKINPDFEYVWLINNDAIIEEKSLVCLKETMSSNESFGAVGSIILNFPLDGIVQNTGVKHYRYLGVSKLINKNKKISEIDFSQEIKFDYLNGASLLLRISALEKSGFFDERYFLYSEEHDLQLSLIKNQYRILLEPKSKVYHQLMGSTKHLSHVFYYHYSKSSVQFSKKHYSKFIFIISTLNLTVINFIRTFPSFKNFKWAVKGIIKGM